MSRPPVGSEGVTEDVGESNEDEPHEGFAERGEVYVHKKAYPTRLTNQLLCRCSRDRHDRRYRRGKPQLLSETC